MTTLILLWAAADPTPDQMRQRIARLEQRVRELEAELASLSEVNRALEQYVADSETQLARLAQEIFRLRQLPGHSAACGEVPATRPARAADTPLPATGPSEPLRAQVLVVGRDIPVVVLDKGSAHGVQPGYRFELVRNDRRVAIVEVERDVTEDGSKSRARFVEGQPRDVLEGDTAIAFVQGLPGAPSSVPVATRPALWRVTGSVNDGYVVNIGHRDGIQTGDLLFVYRGGVPRATLRVEYIDRDWCLAKPASGYPQEPVLEGDDVRRHELPRVVAGRIRAVREDRGIFIDVGTAGGAFTGMRLKASRLGVEVGRLVITDAREFYSICRPHESATTAAFQEGDFVEFVADPAR